MPNPRRIKGHNFERAVVRHLREAGLDARRSGDAQQFDSDVQVGRWRLECKAYRNVGDAVNAGLLQISGREGLRAVVAKRHGKGVGESAVVLPFEVFVWLLGGSG